MKLKKMNRIIMVLLLFTLILGQSSLAFAGKPGGGTTTYVPPTITQGDVLNLAVEDGKTVNFTLNATGTNYTSFTWSNTTTTNGFITKTAPSNIKQTKQSQIVFTYQNTTSVVADTFDVYVTDVKNMNKSDKITINVAITKPRDLQKPVNETVPSIYGSFYFGELITSNPGSWFDVSLPLTYNYQWKVDNVIVSTADQFAPGTELIGKSITLSVQAVDYVGNTSEWISSQSRIITKKPTINYVALGDSIPAGVSYENSKDPKIITSYTDQIASDLQNRYDIVNYNDQGVSGLNIYSKTEPSLYSQVFFDSAIRSYIEQANLITLCIGANDIMDAAPRDLLGGAVNFYNINWEIADIGLDNFYDYWDDIIREIYVLAPENVNIVVMNMYNPYRISDGQGNATAHEVYGTGPLHSIVNKYFYGTEDLNPSKFDGIDYGLNYIIENPQIVYANQLQENGLPLGFEKPYQVVNIYKEFEKDQSTKSNWIAFYDNYWLIFRVQDPHPTVAGQAVLFDLHKSVIAW